MCDLLLQTRTAVWEQSRRVPPAGRQLAEFQQVLTCLRTVSVRLPCALSRVFLHEATVRMMAGAAPARTQQLLERSLRNRSGRSYSVICGQCGEEGRGGGQGVRDMRVTGGLGCGWRFVSQIRLRGATD